MIKSYICGIFKDGDEYCWIDWISDNVVSRIKYFVDPDFFYTLDSDVHEVKKYLRDGELYVVLYYENRTKGFNLFFGRKVDFALTMDEVLENVSAGKYDNGASFHTIGNMMLTTREILESVQC